MVADDANFVIKCFVPVTAASALFSVQGDILPFEPSRTSFGLTILVFTIIMLLIWTFILKWEWYKSIIRLFESRLSSLSMKGKELEDSDQGSEEDDGSTSSGTGQASGRSDIEMAPLLGELP
jgi:hypothetical protein